MSAVDNKVSLTVLGAEKLLAALKPGDITVTADFSKLGVGIHSVPLIIKLPQYLELLESDKSLYVDIELVDNSNPTSTLPEDQTQNPGNNGSVPTEEEKTTDINSNQDGH